MENLYPLIDVFFVIFHTALTLFNLLGWIWKPLRKANLITLLLTGGSWFILGLFFGMGYCPLTDWHFDILRQMGQTNLPSSYIKYLIDRLLHIELSSQLVNTATLIGFLVALVCSLIVNIRRKN